MKFSRYLIFNFLKMFFLILMGAMAMFIIIDFVGNIRAWSNRETADIVEYYKCYLPYIVFLISPVALFLAVISSVGNMSKHLELTAMQSSGQSMFKTLTPIIFLGLFFTLCSFLLSETIMPEANHRRLEIMETNAQKRQNKRVKEKRDFAFIDGEHASWFFRYYSGEKKSGRDVSLLVKNEGRLTERIDAKRIHWDIYTPLKERPKVSAPSKALKKDSSITNTLNSDSLTKADSFLSKSLTDSCWIFENGQYRQFLPDGSIKTTSFLRMPLENGSNTRPKDLINDKQTGDEMNSREVRERISVLRRSGEDTKAMETAYHYKFAGPWTNFFILLIGASLCHRFSRSGGLSQKFGIGIFFVFSYYILIRLGLKMGENVDPLIGAYGPHLVFAVITSVMLYRSFRL